MVHELQLAPHRLATFLLRRERYFPGPGGRWTIKHRHWLSQQHFDDQASRITYADDLHAHDVLLARRDRVGRELEHPPVRAAVRRRVVRGRRRG